MISLRDVVTGFGNRDPLAEVWRRDLRGGGSSAEITGTLPLSFSGRGRPLIDYLISGNTVQDGTPTPEAPVDVLGCGVWDETQQSYKLPLTVNGAEHPIYLGTVPTTRRVRKLVFDGSEEWQIYTFASNTYRLSISSMPSIGNPAFCSHFVNSPISAIDSGKFTVGSTWIYIRYADVADLAAFKSYLAAQYAAGTPVTVWYVLADPETAVVNEPLMKIGDYADTISMVQATVTIPTVSGANVLDMTSPAKPSEVYIKGKGINPTGYGQLVDKNGVRILDNNNVRILVHGQ